MVDGERSNYAAIALIERLATMPREISSRYAGLSANLERLRSGGRMPPDGASSP